jgi:prophage regulatory protein
MVKQLSVPLVILRPNVVSQRTGLHKTSIRRLEEEGLFPQSVTLNTNSTGYYEHEVDQWIRNRPRGGGRRLPPGCSGSPRRVRERLHD